MTEPSLNGFGSRPYVVVVTGASSGIGEATARRLALVPGAAVVVVARREDRLRALTASLGERASFVAVDLLDEDAPERVRSHVAEHHGRLDSARQQRGRRVARHVRDGGYENVRRTMAINFDAATAPD